MKHIYLILLCTFALSSIYAQPGFTSSDLPTIGDQDTVMYLTYYPVTNNLDSETGNGYNWDFSSLPFSTYPNFKYLDTWRVKTHTVSLPFVDATIEEYIADGTDGDVNLFSINHDTLYIYRLGSVLNGSAFIPPIASVVFPVSFNNSSVVNHYFHTGQYITGERKTTFLYDGYGTLKMPNNKTYSNVFRIKKIEKDTSYILQSSITYINYIWYKQGGQVPLLRLAYSGSLNLYSAFGSKANSTSNGLSETDAQNGFMISPNPSDGKFLISGLNFTPDRTEVYNMLGGKVSVVLQGNEIDLSDSGDGVYLVTISSGTTTYARKVIKRQAAK